MCFARRCQRLAIVLRSDHAEQLGKTVGGLRIEKRGHFADSWRISVQRNRNRRNKTLSARLSARTPSTPGLGPKLYDKNWPGLRHCASIRAIMSRATPMAPARSAQFLDNAADHLDRHAVLKRRCDTSIPASCAAKSLCVPALCIADKDLCQAAIGETRANAHVFQSLR